jgi:hypothetical protein
MDELIFRQESIGHLTLHDLGTVLLARGHRGFGPDEIQLIQRLASALEKPTGMWAPADARWRDSDQLDRAESGLNVVLARQRKALRDDHHKTMRTRRARATVCYARGDLQRARDEYQKIVDLCREAVGEGHARTVQARNALAIIDGNFMGVRVGIGMERPRRDRSRGE